MFREKYAETLPRRILKGGEKTADASMVAVAVGGFSFSVSQRALFGFVCVIFAITFFLLKAEICLSW